jgi:Contractile injection system tube protein
MTSLEKAKLIPATGENATQIDFMFNPSELKFARNVAIEQSEGSRTQTGQNKTSFKHPNPYTVTIGNIILDTYEKKDKERNVLVPLKPFTDAVAFAKDGKGKAKRPPIYILTWGKNSYLRCFIKTCNFRLTMFLADGTPVRAILDLTLEQVDDSTPQPSQGTPNVSQSQREAQGRPIFT